MDHHAQFHLMLASESRASCMLDERVTKCVTPPTWYIIFSFVWRPKVTLDSLVQQPCLADMKWYYTQLSSPHVRGGRLLHCPSKLLSFSINKSISEVAGSHLRSLQRTQRNSLPSSCAVWLPENMESQLLLLWFICPFEPRCFPDPRELSFSAYWKYVLFHG